MGVAGWQWVFLIEGLPAVLLAVAVPLFLCDRPSEARWLAADERSWLENTLQRERGEAPGGHLSFAQAIPSSAIMLMMTIYLLIGVGVYGKAYFLPLMIKSLGYTDLSVGYITSIPAFAGVAGMLVFSRSSDRTGERVWHLIVPCVLDGAGVVLAGLFLSVNPILAIAAFSLSSFGISGALPVFWNLPTAFLGPTAAAGGIAFINSVGNVSGYAAPQMVGFLRDSTGSYELPMLVVGAMVLFAGVLVPLAASRRVRAAAVV